MKCDAPCGNCKPGQPSVCTSCPALLELDTENEGTCKCKDPNHTLRNGVCECFEPCGFLKFGDNTCQRCSCWRSDQECGVCSCKIGILGFKIEPASAYEDSEYLGFRVHFYKEEDTARAVTP